MSQNKTGKYFKYAVGEIILVVIGILIALQVNNWNENRKQIAKERTLLIAINKEFLKNRTQLDTVLSYHTTAKKSCEQLISMFPIDVQSSDLNEIGKHIYNILYHYTFNPSQGSINGVINTSALDIISNIQLREILVQWNDLVLDYREDEEVGKTVVRDQLDPLLAKSIDFNFNFDDDRNNLEIFETLEFEYYIRLRLVSLEDILGGSEFANLKHSLDRIIELTSK